MNFFRTILFFVVFLGTNFFAYANVAPHYISLGRDCQAAGLFSLFNLREASFPLDWVVSHEFEGVIKAFDDDFKYFLDPLHLVYCKEYIYNSYYSFCFNHFFPLKGVTVTDHITVPGTVVENYLDYLPEVKATQDRRIQRVKDLLTSNDVVVFVRTHLEPEQAKRFTSLIRKKYPKLKFLLVVVHEQPNLIGNWHIKRVLNYYAQNRSGLADWWDMSEWSNIFQYVQAEVNSYRW